MYSVQSIIASNVGRNRTSRGCTAARSVPPIIRARYVSRPSNLGADTFARAFTEYVGGRFPSTEVTDKEIKMP
jgi:hypothetical protein